MRLGLLLRCCTPASLWPNARGPIVLPPSSLATRFLLQHPMSLLMSDTGLPSLKKGGTMGHGEDREEDVIGPFSPGDSLRIYRLQRKGISFDVQQDLVNPRHPIREAWLALMTQHAMGQPTYVLYDPHDGEAFVQLRYRPHQAAADVVYAAPSLEESPQATGAWSRILNAASIEAARQGIQRVFVNLPASGSEGDVFHQVGFTLYACLLYTSDAADERG